MEVRRRLRRVGNSIIIPILAKKLREAGLAEGDMVRLRSSFRHIDLDSDAEINTEVAAFAARFVERYREALQRLADS